MNARPDRLTGRTAALRALLASGVALLLWPAAAGPASAEAERLQWSAVATGGAHTCAISAADAALYCWGDNSKGQLGMPSRIPPPTPEGKSVPVPPVPAPAPVEGAAAGQAFVAVTAGAAHTCAVTSARRLLCWGANNQGQLGQGTVPGPTTEPSAGPAFLATPTPVAEPLTQRDIAAVAAGGDTTCAVTSEGRAFCWGNNGFGQVGIGATGPPRPTPTPVSKADALASVRVASITVGEGHACALGTDSIAYCWGNNATGQTGTGKAGRPGQGGQTLLPAPVRADPTAAPTRFTSISAGGTFTCGLSAGAALCWGQRTGGRLGDGYSGSNNQSSAFAPQPVRADGALAGRALVSISAGRASACVLDKVGSAVCWGSNEYGQMGDGKSGERAGQLPTPVSETPSYPGLGLATIAVGSSHVCAVLAPQAGGLMACWGNNSAGQLGIGSLAATTAATPRAVAKPLGANGPTASPTGEPSPDSGGGGAKPRSALPLPLIIGGGLVIVLLLVAWFLVRKRGQKSA